MVTPQMSKKIGTIGLTPTQNAKRLFQAVYYAQNPSKESDAEGPKLNVSEIVSKMAFYYEKIRNTVEYKEEHLLRKNAIERILWRQIVIESSLADRSKGDGIAEHLLTELIRATYLPNNTILKSKCHEIGAIINKYLKLRKYALEDFNYLQIKEKNELTRWVIAIAASEIEEQLGRNQVDKVVIDYMYQVLLENIKLPDDTKFEDDKEVQIYIGIHRSYLKFDKDMLGYILLKFFHPNWQKAGADDSIVAELGKQLLKLKEEIEEQVEHPLAGQLNRIIARYTVFFSILCDVVADNPVKVYESFVKDPKAFSRLIKRSAEKRYSKAKSKLWRAAVHSILYIFITKSFLAFLLEIPATRWFGEEINAISLFINITFPAILLFLIVLFTRMPSSGNTEKIVEGIEEIVFIERERKDPFRLRIPSKRSAFMNTMFGIIYAVTSISSFGFIIWALDKINFSFVSIIIFLFFLALISFFSIRIRKSNRELLILPPRDTALGLLGDFFYVPIIQTGKWLSENFSKINVFVFVLDFIIEAPFKVFVAITEEWTKYVRERKDEI
ncbi:MAG: hypothetical protein U9Q85_00720 [Patescibacteria group bacterium]|nr:hypothetical protein [Patescibacteria group bacterium]